MPKDAPTLERVLPRDYLRFARAGVSDGTGRAERPYRMPAADAGPYYIEWRPGGGPYGEDRGSARPKMRRVSS